MEPGGFWDDLLASPTVGQAPLERHNGAGGKGTLQLPLWALGSGCPWQQAAQPGESAQNPGLSLAASPAQASCD